jgi:hypothetical protein
MNHTEIQFRTAYNVQLINIIHNHFKNVILVE